MKPSVFALKGALLVVAVLAGCQGDPAPGTDVKSDPAMKGTTAATQKPAEAPTAAAKLAGDTTAAKPADTAAAKSAGDAYAAKPGDTAAAKPTGDVLAAPGAGQAAPAVPDGTSAPPSVAEWQAAPSANTVGANSAPRDCELKVVREWLKVNCIGNIKEVTNMEGFGKKGFDYFEVVTPGKVVDLVVRMKKGQAIKARILREGQSASLFVNWPQASPKPSIVALQIYNP